MFESLDILSTAITAILSAGVTAAGTFLYYKQERDKRDIENESLQSEEWKKLYLESKEDSAKKDKKIDECLGEVNELRKQLIQLERKVQLSHIYACTNLQCPNRECLQRKEE